MTVQSRILLAALIVPLSCLYSSCVLGQGLGGDLGVTIPADALKISSPFKHFDSACKHCVKLDHKNVAREIRKGVSFLEGETKHARAKGREALLGSTAELTKVARSIENGKTFTAEQLREKFARAHQALAIHHHQMAENARSQNRLGDASEALQKAAVNLKHGVSWTGEKLVLEPGARLIDSSRKVTDVLIDGTIEGTSRSVKAVGGGIGLLGEQIKRVGNLIKHTTKR